MSDAITTDKPVWIKTVLNEFEQPLLRYAAQITGDVELARDVVQETFLKLCREDVGNQNGHLPRWLYTVCRHGAIDIHRQRRKMRVISDDVAEPLADATANPAMLAERFDEHRRLAAAIGTLAQNQREVVYLRFSGGLSYKDIAAVTSLSVSNVGYLIHTAIREIRGQMGDDSPTELRNTNRAKP